jgi:hypothetical protein
MRVLEVAFQHHGDWLVVVAVVVVVVVGAGFDLYSTVQYWYAGIAALGANGEKSPCLYAWMVDPVWASLGRAMSGRRRVVVCQLHPLKSLGGKGESAKLPFDAVWKQ